MSAGTHSDPRGGGSGNNVPEFLGRYEVLFPLASGGMAEVYVARLVGEEGFSRPVAIKRMLPSLNENEHFEKMFLQEARVSANIRSPNVVQTIELGRASDDSLFIVMELVEGIPLHRLIRSMNDSKQDFSLSDALEILHQVATGLHHAHEALDAGGKPLGIVHRDLSPQNVLLSDRGRCLIVDFGVAKVLSSNELTSAGQLKGKLAYMSPEQMEGGAIDRRSDVFAIGVLAWEILAGRRLFKADSPAITMRLVFEGEVPPLAGERADVPEELCELVHRALARDREARFATAAELVEAIERLPVPRSGPHALERLVAEHAGPQLAELRSKLHAAAEKPRPAEKPPHASKPKVVTSESVVSESRRGPSLLVVAVGLLLLVVGAVALARRSKPGEEGTPSAHEEENVVAPVPVEARSEPVGSSETYAMDSAPEEPSVTPSVATEVEVEASAPATRRGPRTSRRTAPADEPTPEVTPPSSPAVQAESPPPAHDRRTSMVSIQDVDAFDRFVGMGAR